MRCVLSCHCYSVPMILDLCIAKRCPYLRCILFVECSLLTETAKDDKNLHDLGFAMRDFSRALLTRIEQK